MIVIYIIGVFDFSIGEDKILDIKLYEGIIFIFCSSG